MAQKSLTTSYLSFLSNANHDGVTTQIYERLSAFMTDNQMLQTAIQGVGTTRDAEDFAFIRFSSKDFASDDLKKEDSLEDKYMSVSRGILNALLNLPEEEPLRRKAQLAVQLYKDFDFRVSDGFEAEARKTVNMVQEWTGHPEKYDLDALGIRPWVNKANEQAVKVLQLITVRVDNESAKVKGELAEARKATDAAIRQAYDVLNALNVLQPSTELSALINVLFGIEERAKLYYISSASGAGVGTNTGEVPTSTDGGDQGQQTGGDNGQQSTDNGQQTGGDQGQQSTDNGQQTGGDDNPGGDNPGGGDGPIED